MQYESISTADHLEQFCDEIAQCSRIAFDTEFVSEDSYRPLLCLIQVAAGDRLAIIDPIPVDETEPFWHLLTEPGRTVIAHAAREEARFCYRYNRQTDRRALRHATGRGFRWHGIPGIAGHTGATFVQQNTAQG